MQQLCLQLHPHLCFILSKSRTDTTGTLIAAVYEPQPPF